MDLEFEIAQLDENLGLAYLDSGAPPGSDDFATLVCVHGHSYHARENLCASHDGIFSYNLCIM